MVEFILLVYVFSVALTVMFIDMHNLMYKPKMSFFWCIFSIFTVLFLIFNEYKQKNKMIVNNSLEFIDECS
jgi:hypothetical protein